MAALVSGCSLLGAGGSDAGPARHNECRWNPSSCMYEGSYEAGERDYAEEEARRLNQEQMEKLRPRRSIWDLF